MKKIIAVLLALTCSMISFSASAAGIYIGADNIIKSGYIQSEKVGNIFSVTDENITFTQSYKNIADKTATVQSVYQVLDESGKVVKEYPTRSFEIPEAEEVTLNFTIENPGEYGLYTLRVKNSVKLNWITYPKTYDEGFSVCIDLDENNADPNFGFAQHIISNGYGDADVTPALMRNVGASWYREECLKWGMVEQTKGELKIPEGAIEKLQKIKDSGLEIVCILNGVTGFTYGSLENTIEAYAAYCKFVAEKLDGIVDHYEIWNEWNGREGDNTTETYAKVLSAGYKAVKAANENNTVIGCVTAGIEYEWIDDVITKLNGEKAMDAVSVHCYPWDASRGVIEWTIDEKNPGLIDSTAKLKEVLQNHSLDIPVYLTEIGFSTYDGTKIWIDPCTYEQQLNALVFVNAINKAYGLYDKLFQYCFHDRANKAGVESNWGLVNCWQRGYTGNPEAELTPYGAKPSYLGIAAMNYFIGGNAEYQEMRKDNQDRAYLIKFKNNNLRKNVMLCINNAIDTTVEKSIELGTDKVKVYDKYGNFVEDKTSETGTFTFEVSPEPMYVTWAFEGEEDVTVNGEFLNVAVNQNTKTITISGSAPKSQDLVSVMVVSKDEELSEYDPNKVLYVGQVTADAYKNYSLSFTVENFAGEFDIYANSKERREMQKDDLVISYTFPEIKVMQEGNDVSAMSELNASVPVDVELRGFRDLTDENPVLIIAQYSGGKLLFAEYNKEAVGDCSKPGDEIKKSFEIKDGTDRIKIMYMNTTNAKPFVTAYEIK